MEGEIGTGKSTTCTTLMYLYCKPLGIDHRQKQFKFGRQTERVTTTVKTIHANDLSIMDTPGTNDFQNELSDYDIAKMKHISMNTEFSNAVKGVSCIAQTIMIDSGGRLKQTSVDNLAKTFHSLTYSFPSYDRQKHGGPMIAIIFTNFSKQYEDDDDIMIEGVESSTSII